MVESVKDRLLHLLIPKDGLPFDWYTKLGLEIVRVSPPELCSPPRVLARLTEPQRKTVPLLDYLETCEAMLAEPLTDEEIGQWLLSLWGEKHPLADKAADALLDLTAYLQRIERESPLSG